MAGRRDSYNFPNNPSGEEQSYLSGLLNRGSNDYQTFLNESDDENNLEEKMYSPNGVPRRSLSTFSYVFPNSPNKFQIKVEALEAGLSPASPVSNAIVPNLQTEELEEKSYSAPNTPAPLSVPLNILALLLLFSLAATESSELLTDPKNNNSVGITAAILVFLNLTYLMYEPIFHKVQEVRDFYNDLTLSSFLTLIWPDHWVIGFAAGLTVLSPAFVLMDDRYHYLKINTLDHDYLKITSVVFGILAWTFSILQVASNLLFKAELLVAVRRWYSEGSFFREFWDTFSKYRNLAIAAICAPKELLNGFSRLLHSEVILKKIFGLELSTASNGVLIGLSLLDSIPSLVAIFTVLSKHFSRMPHFMEKCESLIFPLLLGFLIAYLKNNDTNELTRKRFGEDLFQKVLVIVNFIFDLFSNAFKFMPVFEQLQNLQNLHILIEQGQNYFLNHFFGGHEANEEIRHLIQEEKSDIINDDLTVNIADDNGLSNNEIDLDLAQMAQNEDVTIVSVPVSVLPNSLFNRSHSMSEVELVRRSEDANAVDDQRLSGFSFS